MILDDQVFLNECPLFSPLLAGEADAAWITDSSKITTAAGEGVGIKTIFNAGNVTPNRKKRLDEKGIPQGTLCQCEYPHPPLSTAVDQPNIQPASASPARRGENRGHSFKKT